MKLNVKAKAKQQGESSIRLSRKQEKQKVPCIFINCLQPCRHILR
ncbi:hypothetical protein M080_4740, partial [Bacteroides fragilis str. 3397 T10]